MMIESRAALLWKIASTAMAVKNTQLCTWECFRDKINTTGHCNDTTSYNLFI